MIYSFVAQGWKFRKKKAQSKANEFSGVFLLARPCWKKIVFIVHLCLRLRYFVDIRLRQAHRTLSRHTRRVIEIYWFLSILISFTPLIEIIIGNLGLFLSLDSLFIDKNLDKAIGFISESEWFAFLLAKGLLYWFFSLKFFCFCSRSSFWFFSLL